MDRRAQALTVCVGILAKIYNFKKIIVPNCVLDQHKMYELL